jgi:hypothetical protein
VKKGKFIENVEIMTNFIMYGQIGVLSCKNASIEEKVKQIREFINSILEIK